MRTDIQQWLYAIEHDDELNEFDDAVAEQLAARVGPLGNVAHISYGDLCDRLGLGRADRDVWESLRVLRERGYLSRYHGSAWQGRATQHPTAGFELATA